MPLIIPLCIIQCAHSNHIFSSHQSILPVHGYSNCCLVISLDVRASTEFTYMPIIHCALLMPFQTNAFLSSTTAICQPLLGFPSTDWQTGSIAPTCGCCHSA